jgi:mono/diheme cytochrome c family protein
VCDPDGRPAVAPSKEAVIKIRTAALFLTAAIVASSAVAATPKVVGNAKNGKKWFTAQQCGACHLMAAAGALNGSGIGSDLDQSRKTYAQLITQITKGGHGMTGYAHVLTSSQIQDLAAFIYTVSHRK